MRGCSLKSATTSSIRTWRVEDHAESVASGKTLADIARDPRAPHWQSDRPSATAERARTRAAARTRRGRARISRARCSRRPSTAPFDDPKWLFELKWDGYRAIVRVERDGTVAIASRNGKDFAAEVSRTRSPRRARSPNGPSSSTARSSSSTRDGKPSFGALQERLDRFGRTAPEKRPVTFVAFDLLYGNGRDLRGEPLTERKAALEAILTGPGPAMFSKHVTGTGTHALRTRKGTRPRRHRRQARRLDLSGAPFQRLGEDQSGRPSGSRDRRLDRSARQPQAFRRAAGRRLRRRDAPLCRLRRHRLRRQEARGDRREARAARAHDVARSTSGRRPRRPRTGSRRRSSRRSRSRSGRATARCATPSSSHCASDKDPHDVVRERAEPAPPRAKAAARKRA